MLALVGLCLVAVFGFLLLSCAWGRSALSRGERLALGYGVGLGVFTYLMFGALAVGVRLSRLSILIALVTLSAALGLATWRWRGPSAFGAVGAPAAEPPATSHVRHPGSASLAAVIALVALSLSALAVALYWPIWTWDALTMFDYRGRAIAVQQSLAFLRHEAYWGSFPLLTSLGHALVRVLDGTTPNVLYPLYYASLLAVFYLNVAKLSGGLAAAGFTVIVATTPLLWQHAAEPLTNLPFTFYYGVGTMYVYRWVVARERSHLLLGGLLMGLSAWTRYGSEPLVLAVAIPVTVCALRRREPSAPVLFLLMFALVEAPWLLYQRYVLEVGPAYALYGVRAALWDGPRLLRTLTYLSWFLGSVHTHGAVWLMFFVSLCLNAPRWRDPSTWLAGMTLLGLMAWTASIYLTVLSVEYLAPTSGERLLLFLVPVAALYCAVSPTARRGAVALRPSSGWAGAVDATSPGGGR